MVLELKSPTIEHVKMPEYPERMEDDEILATIESLREELAVLHNRFDQAIAPMLIDSLIYEIQAVHIRYEYYLNLCKEREILIEKFKFA